MIPHKATLKNAIGILAGMGREELTIDFDKEVPADAQMVAIKGDNGVGKSTFMDLAMVPWIKPPQIDGTLYDYFFDRGVRELWWSHDGTHYHSKILINQSGESRSTKAYLQVDGRPYACQNGLASDGKVRTYTACVEDILGPQSIYYLSAYRAQGAPKLAQYDKPKDLMRDLLSLDRTHELAQKAGKVRATLEAEAGKLDAKVAETKEGRERVLELSCDIDKQRKLIAARQEERDDVEHRRALAQAEYEKAVKDGVDNARMQNAIDDMDKRIRATKLAASTGLRAVEQSRNTACRHKDGIETQHNAWLERHNKGIDNLICEKKGIGGLLAREEEIRQAAAEYDALDVNINKLRDQQEGLDKDLAEVSALNLEMAEVTATVHMVVREGQQLGREVDALENRADFVARVPCQGEGKYADCPALEEAHQASRELSTVRGLKKEKADEYRAASAQHQDMKGRAEKYGDVKAELRAVRSEINALKDRWEVLRPKAKELGELNAAHDRLNDLDAREAEKREEMEAVTMAYVDAMEEAGRSVEEAKKHVDSVKKQNEVALATLEKERAGLPIPSDDTTKQLKDVAENWRRTADESGKAYERAVASNEQMKAERNGLERMMARNKTAVDSHDKLVEEVGGWVLLECGLYGTIDLSIEAAGPAIAAASNLLLSSAYGPRFTVKIITQRQNQSNLNIREVFAINVIDGDTGREDDVLKKSGGEGVWIGKALTDGVGIYYQESSGVRYETQFGDEVEDGLTSERKQLYYQMDKAAMQAGGYARKYYVSHNAGAWAIADHIIDFDKLRRA